MNDVFCHSCGHRNPLGANYCSSCGTALEQAADATIAFSPVDTMAEILDEDIRITDDALSRGFGVLVVKRGPDAGAGYVLDKAVTHVGRHPESEIFLDDVTVSRRHAELLRRDEDGLTYCLKDAGSLNGTYVNRERIEQVALMSGDEVQIGKFKLVYLAPPSA